VEHYSSRLGRYFDGKKPWLFLCIRQIPGFPGQSEKHRQVKYLDSCNLAGTSSFASCRTEEISGISQWIVIVPAWGTGKSHGKTMNDPCSPGNIGYI